MRRDYSKEEIGSVVKNSFAWADVCKAFGKVPSTRTASFFREQCIKHGVSFAHFDKTKRNREKAIYTTTVKICPFCSNEFETASGGKKAKLFCSRKCANSSIVHLNHTSESNKKRSEAFLKKLSDKYNDVEIIDGKFYFKKCCEFCQKDYNTKKKYSRFCCGSCSTKYLWTTDDYRNKVINGINEIVKNGDHQGWTSRNKLSYPEKFFKKVFELNGLVDKFKINAPIPKKELGFDCTACYFLDFYFPHIKLDVEIDGKQHNYSDRAESDKVRDSALIKNGYLIHRIPWKSLNKPAGKEFIRLEIAKLLAKIKDLERNIG